MSTMTRRDVDHIFEALRMGLVPERGIEAIAEGIEKQRGEIHRQLELVRAGEGTIKFLRGGYGCGKTFMARLAALDAQNRNFATSFVIVSEAEFRFHRFDDVYRKVMTELGTAVCPRGAFGDILDRWIARIEASLGEAADDDPDFDAKVRKRLDDDLVSATNGQAPQDFVSVIQTIFDLKQKGKVAEAGALISWLCGSSNIGAATKKLANIKGEIESGTALDYLRGVVAIIKAAGYDGLVIVIDEAETILRMRKDSRHKSLNGIRQIADAAGSYPGLLWLITGTPDFFDTQHGVRGLPPLYDRIRFIDQGRFVSVRQAQLPLVPFGAERLRAVALHLRRIYVPQDPERFLERITDAFIDRLVADVTAGFKGNVGVVPRQFLREFVTQMDLVDENPEYDPARDYAFKLPELSDLTAHEQHVITGQPLLIAEDATGEPVLKEDVW